MSDNKSSSGSGAFVGGIIAVILSAALNHSFFWGLLHFFCGWFYVLYVALCRTKEIVPSLQKMFM